VTSKLDVTTDESQIRQRLESWTKALRSKDLDGLMSHYAEDILVFDIAPPLTTARFPSAGKEPTHWSFWPTSMYVPRPGCYGVQIDTPQGMYIVVFSATAATRSGRVSGH